MVIGASGQDGSYLCELLVEHDYDVTGVVRRAVGDEMPNLASVRSDIELVQADLADSSRLEGIFRSIRPAETYNLASVSFGPDAWADPVTTTQLGTVAVCGLLEAIRRVSPGTKFFQASSAWIFGRPGRVPQDEATPYAPIEPYGAAKAHSSFLVDAYRRRHGLFGCSGIFYNHESPRRAERFVTRKITRAAAAIKLGLEQELVLGDLDPVRDWGYAKDFVRAAWLMLQDDEPSDYVIATGETHSVRELVEVAFAHVGLDWRNHVRRDVALARGAADLANLVGNSAAARRRLGWSPSLRFDELVKVMVDSDLRALSIEGPPTQAH